MGSIERTPAGTWKARYRDIQGRSRRKTFKRKRDAEMFLSSADVGMRRGEWVDPRAWRLLLAEWVEKWRTTTGHLRASTADRYERDLRLHVLPRFGTMRLSGITPRDVRAWLSEMTAAGGRRERGQPPVPGAADAAELGRSQRAHRTLADQGREVGHSSIAVTLDRWFRASQARPTTGGCRK